MNFLLPDRKRKFNKLTGTNPTKLYVPINAGRTVGKPNQKAYGGFNAAKNSEAVELTSWIGNRIDDNTITVDRFNTSVSSLSADTTLTAQNSPSVYLVDATSAVTTITLPAPADVKFPITVKKIDVSANNVTVDTPGSETIDGAADDTIASQYDSVTYVTDGSNWFTV